MGDYCSGTITIGGHIPAQLLPEFCALLKEEGVTIQHGDIDFAPTTADDIRNALNPDRHLEFYNDELRNGCYEALEAWLVRHHIGFIRWSGSCGGYLPEVVHYRKKLGFQSFLTNEDCQILIGEEQVLTACRLLEAGRPDSAYLLLRSATPNHLPALPPLTIGKPSRRRTHTTPLRGVLLSGLGGSGKSHFAKALGNQIGWPTLCLDFGKIYGGERGREGIVGSAEAMLRRALHIVDAMSPCIVFTDEIDKGLGGIQSSHATDGGVGSRLFGTFLTWMQNHTTDVFVIGCSNRLDHIPPEFTRSGRFDAVFFCDLPDAEERREILDIYARTYGITIPHNIETHIDLNLWTGAELKQLCIETAFHPSGNIIEAALMIKPLYKPLANTEVKSLREWAATRCLSARMGPHLANPTQFNTTAPPLRTHHT